MLNFIQRRTKKGDKKMSFDFSELKGKIIAKYKSQSNFSKRLGVSEITLSKKMNNKTHFSSDDIAKICDLLSISQEEIGIYFFTPKV